MPPALLQLPLLVNRRIAGLENDAVSASKDSIVNRRIGGLESIYSGQWGA